MEPTSGFEPLTCALRIGSGTTSHNRPQCVTVDVARVSGVWFDCEVLPYLVVFRGQLPHECPMGEGVERERSWIDVGDLVDPKPCHSYRSLAKSWSIAARLA